MPGRKYERLSVEEFGQRLIVTRDLDPVYVALHDCPFDHATMSRWLLGYWCTYHCGVASYLSDQTDEDFWKFLMRAAVNETPAPGGGRWPRGSERRHWRGQQAVRSAEDLQARSGGDPGALVEALWKGPMDYASVARRVKEWRGFGDWISFKVADMIDRVQCRPVDFDEAAVFMFKDPAKAALMVYNQRNSRGIDIDNCTREQRAAAIHAVVTYLTAYFDDLKAPPLYDRPVGLQEVETVLCKWKSHMNGHYPLFNDIDEINHGMVNWVPLSRNAEHFARCMPKREDRTR